MVTLSVCRMNLLLPLLPFGKREQLTSLVAAAEPDRSNPTRNRWERPLDTIRSFEAAIDGGYSSRKSYIRSGSYTLPTIELELRDNMMIDADSESVAWGNNRRNSHYAGSKFDPLPLYSRYAHDANRRPWRSIPKRQLLWESALVDYVSQPTRWQSVRFASRRRTGTAGKLL
jgi:hypothetical protein